MIRLLLGFVSLVFWAAAALFVAAGVSMRGDEGAWASVVGSLVAALPAYVAWVFARAGLRSRHSSAVSDSALRRYAVKDMLTLALPFGVIFWLLTGSVFLGAMFGFVALTARGLRAVQELERPRSTAHPTGGGDLAGGRGGSRLSRVLARMRALLFMDADEAFERMQRRRRGRFRRNPLRMHLLYLGAYLLGYATFWHIAGTKAALVILGAFGVLLAANTLAVLARRARRR